MKNKNMNENMRKDIYEKISDIEKKFLYQKKYRNFELYKEYQQLKVLRYYYNFSKNIRDIEKQRKEKERIIKEVKKIEIKEKEEKPIKPIINKNEITAYEMKLYKIVNVLFDYLISKKNYAYLFNTGIMRELKLYLKDLIKYFEFRYKKSENLIMIRIMDLNKCLEIKEKLNNIYK